MPLDKSGSKEAFEKNVKTEVDAGKSQKQAVAIAYSVAGEDQATAAGIVFHSNGRVLLLKRPDGTWGFPAGGVEDGETPEQAARRELMEETGHVWQGPLQQIGVFDGFFVSFFADCEQFDVVLNDEHEGFGWIDYNELPAPLHGCAGNVLAAILTANTGDKADSARQFDINGFFEVQDNPLSKVGVFNYLGKNIPQERDKGNGGKMFSVYRPAEELADPECLASFRLQPWVIDHTMIGDGTNGTTTAEEKIVRGVTGEQIYFEGDTMYGNIKCFSSLLAGQIANGKTPLSLGYRCVYEYAPGSFNGIPYTYVQRRIRGNHLATVDDGRMGPEVAVMDGSETLLTEKPEMSKKQKEALIKAKTKAGQVRNGLLAFAMDAEEKIEAGEDESGELQQAVDAIKSVAPLLEAVDELKCLGEVDDLAVSGDTAQMPGDERTKGGAGLDEDDEDKDKPKGKEGEGMDAKEIARIVDAAVTKALAARGTGMDAAEVVHTIAQRDALARKVSEFTGAFDASEMTAQGVAEYAVQKLEIPARKGAEIDVVTAWLHGRTPARQLPVAHAGDAKDAGNKPSFLAAQVAERS